MLVAACVWTCGSWQPRGCGQDWTTGLWVGDYEAGSWLSAHDVPSLVVQLQQSGEKSRGQDVHHYPPVCSYHHLRQWRTFSLPFLRVGQWYLPFLCSGKVWFGTSQTLESGGYVHCQGVPLHQVPSARCFPALNPNIILGLHLLSPLYRASIAPFAITWYRGFHEENVALAMDWTRLFSQGMLMPYHAWTHLHPTATTFWPWLLHQANSWVALPVQGNHLSSSSALHWPDSCTDRCLLMALPFLICVFYL